MDKNQDRKMHASDGTSEESAPDGEELDMNISSPPPLRARTAGVTQ